MPIAVAKNYRVWVCLPDEAPTAGFEVTEFCSGDSGGYLSVASSPLDESGIMPSTGRLVLAADPRDEQLNPWKTPARWAIGNRVWARVADSSGTLRPLPINGLFILAIPTPPTFASPQLELELGDFSRLYERLPAPSTLLTGSRSAIIGQLLAKTGLSNVSSISGILRGYRANGGQAVDEAAVLAIGGHSTLFQDSQGRISSVKVNLKPHWRLFLHQVGVDDAGDFAPLQNPLLPSSEVETVVAESAVDRPNPPDPFKYRGFRNTTEPLARVIIDESGDSTEVTAIVRQERWQWQANRWSQTIEEQRCRGLIVPEDLYLFLIEQGRPNLFYPSPYALFNALLIEEEKVYEGQGEGRLLRHATKIYKRRGEVLSEFYKKTLTPTSVLPNFLDPFLAEEIEIRYGYLNEDGEDSQGQVRSIELKRWLPKGQVGANATDWLLPDGSLSASPTDLVVAESRKQTWLKRSKDEWEYKDRQYQAGRVRAGTLKAWLRPVRVGGPETTSRDGSIRPPAAERRPAREQAEPVRPLDRPLRGKVGFKGAVARPLQIQVNHAADPRRVSELVGSLDKARHQGFQLTTALRDEWFWWKPLSRVDVSYLGDVYLGVTDLVQFNLAADRVIVTADCMKIGEIPGGDSYPFQPLPALLPSDPDPDPLGAIPIGGSLPDPSGDYSAIEYPEVLFEQPLLPAVEVIQELAIESEFSVGFALALLDDAPSQEFKPQSEASILFAEILAPQFEFEVEFIPLPVLFAQFESRVDFLEPVSGLFAEWKLDAGSWLDSAGSNHLSEEGEGPLLVFDADISESCAEFGYELSEFFYEAEFNHLFIADGSALSTRTASANWSWRLEFSIKFSSDESAYRPSGAIVELENEFSIGFDGDGAYRLSLFNDSDSNASAAIAFNFELLNDEWIDMAVEFFADIPEIRTYLNGVLKSAIGVAEAITLEDPGILEASTGAFRVGRGAGWGTRISNVKFFKNELITRS